MLQSIREMTKHWIFKGLMILLVVSFGLWGIGDMFRGNPQQRTVASVGGVAIPVQSLETRFRLGLPEARSVFGPDLTLEKARKIGVLDRTLNLMIEEISFNLEAIRLGISVSDQMALETIAKQPGFRDANGKFNAEMWHRLLTQSGMTERFFLDNVEKEKARAVILSTLAGNMLPPKIMIDSLYEARGAKRLFEVLTIQDHSFTDISKPSDDDLMAFYKENEGLFFAPEYRAVTVATLSPEALQDDISISDEDVKAEYEKRKEELMEPETRDVVQVVLQDEGKAKALYDAAEKAGDLSKAAKAHGMTPIMMKKISEKTVLPELYTTLFSNEEKQVSPPVKTSLGYHVTQVMKVYTGGLPVFDEVKESLKKSLKEERQGDYLATTINKLDDALAGGRSLEDIADDLRLHLMRYAAIDQAGKDTEGKEIKDIPNKQELLHIAYGLSDGDASPVQEGGNGGYYVVRLDKITPSQARPFDEVKMRVTSAWIQKKQHEKAVAEAEMIAKAIREGKKVADFATTRGVSIRLSKPVSLLGEPDNDIPSKIAPQMFVMKPGDVITAQTPDKQYVLRLSSIVPVSAKDPEPIRIKVAEQVKEDLPLDMVKQYMEHLHKVFSVKINKDLFESLKNRDANE
ncbi:MAG: peptidyl-prolyl cis-trans isomerase [Alphaproteobacteria bacterium]|jgi:peptidyl-prolyl cis-trans isomerase D|nr:peptidyl-prolyl cis-trans isomerase [Alphaproteobacteria bacterium]